MTSLRIVVVCLLLLTWADATPRVAPRVTVDLPVFRPVVVAVTRPTDSVLCLAQTLFFEANTEPEDGQEAVAATVFNRMASHQYPSSLCGVVYQPFQFSWTMDTDTWTRRPPSRFFAMARTFLQQRYVLQSLYPATHFHRDDVSPKWADSLTYVGQFGAHKFYRLAPID